MAQATGFVKLVALSSGVVVAIFVAGPSGAKSLFGDLREVFAKHFQQQPGVGHADTIASTEALALVKELGKQVRLLQTRYSSGNQPTIIVDGGRQGGSTLLYVIPALAFGLGAYGYLRLKGITFKDFMYVTQKGLAGALSGVQKKMEGLGASLQATRRQLTARLEGVAKGVEEGRVVQDEIKLQVGELKEDLGQVGYDVESLQRTMQSLEFKVEEVKSSLDMTNRGVYFLCSFVKDGLDTHSHQYDMLQGLRTKSMDRCASLPAHPEGRQALKGLQLVAEALKPADENTAISGAVGRGRQPVAAGVRLPRAPSLRS